MHLDLSHDQLFSILFCCEYVSNPLKNRKKGVGHLRAPDDLSNVVNAVGQLSQLLATRQAGSNVA